MRKVFTGALALALLGGLAAAAISGGVTTARHATLNDAGERAALRATGTYEGEFKPPRQQGSEVTVKAQIKNGEVKGVKRFGYLALMRCDKSGDTPGESGWIFGGGGIEVKPNRRFSLTGDSVETPRSTFTLKGRFNRKLTKVKGTFKTHQWFPAEPDAEPEPLPAEYCNLAPTRFVATR
jgi:hypothetical protein